MKETLEQAKAVITALAENKELINEIIDELGPLSENYMMRFGRSLARIVAAHYHELLKCGMTPHEALVLTVNFKSALTEMTQNYQNERKVS